MKKNVSLLVLGLFVTLFSLPLIAQTQKTIDIDLWQDGLPNTNGIDTTQPFDDEARNYKPSIRVYFPHEENRTGRAIIAYPGGGYTNLAYNHEGYDWVPFFNKLGITYIVLKYRMPRGNNEVPGSDAREAIRIVREKAAEWNINPNDIGIMGSSAGGHLASTMATHNEAAVRPDFQILFYPVISMDKSFSHTGSHDNLLGKDASAELENKYSNDKQVTKDTPRAFIAFSDDDKTVSPIHGIKYYQALHANKVPASLYIYPSGGHGWGIRENFLYKNEMLNDLMAWLRSF